MPSNTSTLTAPDAIIERINPDFTYGIESSEVKCVIRLSRSRIDDAVSEGLLEHPVDYLAGGRKKGFTGRQLLRIQARREEAAAEKDRARDKALVTKRACPMAPSPDHPRASTTKLAENSPRSRAAAWKSKKA